MMFIDMNLLRKNPIKNLFQDILSDVIDLTVGDLLGSGWTGRRGEKLTERELKVASFFGKYGKTLKNIYVPKKDGTTSEIDVLFITQKGIFVLESKNYSGWIFGDENCLNWTACLSNGKKNKFYNPIKQNQTHIKWLKKYLESFGFVNVAFFSVIVFSERCELKKVTAEKSEAKVLKRKQLFEYILDIWRKVPDVLSQVEAEIITDVLRKLTNVSDEEKKKHVEQVSKNRVEKEVLRESVIADYAQTERVIDKSQIERTIEKGKTKAIINDQKLEVVVDDLKTRNEVICPKCNRKMVLRIAKKGQNIGKQFYGCTGFPECRSILNIDLN